MSPISGYLVRPPVQQNSDPSTALVGTVFAARCLGMSPEGLRKRIANNQGSLRPVGQMSDPPRWLFRRIDVIAAVAEQNLLAHETK